MNKTYALVWSESRGAWVAARERVRRKGKSKTGARIAAAGIAMVGTGALGSVHALPTGENVTHGIAEITRDGTEMVIKQHTDKIITNWDSFDISSGHGVRFEQPDKDSVALNKVGSFYPTHINGRLDANGQVFLINPGGILFGNSAQVNVGGLAASTKEIQDADFISGHYAFSGTSYSAVENYGSITALEGGSIALLAPAVKNQGVIRAEMGTIALSAGDAFTLTFNGNQLLSVQIDRSTARALVENGNLLKADGGQVLITAAAANATLNTVVNSNGIIEANTLNGSTGRITLDGGEHGRVEVAGNMAASATHGAGDGGTIDLRGNDVHIKQSAHVDTRARQGKDGIWNIETGSVKVATPGSASAALTMANTTLGQNLQTTDISIRATSGDVAINGPVSWASRNGLTLNAQGNVIVNSAVRSAGQDVHLSLNAGDRILINGSLGVTGDRGRIALNAQNGHTLADGTSITLSGSQAVFSANGKAYSVIQNQAQLQAIDQRLDGNYVLGNSIRGDRNFKAIGGESRVFTGTLDGLGHTLDTFSITGSGPNLGVFAASSGSIRNLALKSVTISAPYNNLAGLSMGSLVGRNTGDLYNVKSRSTTVHGAANRENVIGGLVGTNEGGRIERAAVSGNVYTNDYTRAAGGLVGQNIGGSRNLGQVLASSSDATVSGQMQRSYTGGMGGLIGFNHYGVVQDSTVRGKTVAKSDGVNVGGLVGTNSYSRIERSHASGLVQGGKHGNTGGLVGGTIAGALIDSTANNTVQAYGGGNSGGAVGRNSGGGKLLNVSSTSTVADWHGQNVGGLVGANLDNESVIDQGYSAGHVDARDSAANAYVGGLVGYNNGVVVDSDSRAKVNGGHGAQAGGLAGYNDRLLQRVTASGTVHAKNHSSVGGLVGGNAGLIDTAAASGDVWGDYQSRIGGIAGVNLHSGRLINTTTRSVLDGGIHSTLGGAVGFNQGLIEAVSVQGNIKTHWYTWMLGQTRGAVTGKNAGLIR